MTEALQGFDTYWRIARLYPAMLVTAPAIVTVGAAPATQGLLKAPVLSFGLLSIFLIAALYLAGTIARVGGRKVQKRLLEEWECLPTTQFLRHNDNTLPLQTRERYRTFLESGVGKLPSKASETRNPAKADAAYDDAINWLKEQRRGPRFTLLLKENAEFGFRRNMRGLKALGLLVILLSMVLLVPLHQMRFAWPLSGSSPAFWVSSCLNLAFAAFWLFLVNDAWVRAAAEQYARTLLASCDAP